MRHRPGSDQRAEQVFRVDSDHKKRQIRIRNNSMINPAPTSPNSSHTIEKIISFCASGKNPNFWTLSPSLCRTIHPIQSRKALEVSGILFDIFPDFSKLQDAPNDSFPSQENRHKSTAATPIQINCAYFGLATKIRDYGDPQNDDRCNSDYLRPPAQRSAEPGLSRLPYKCGTFPISFTFASQAMPEIRSTQLSQIQTAETKRSQRQPSFGPVVLISHKHDRHRQQHCRHISKHLPNAAHMIINRSCYQKHSRKSSAVANPCFFK